MKELDLIPRLNSYINSLNLGLRSTIGILDTGNSMAIAPLPANNDTVYMDGSRDREQNIQVLVKHSNGGAVFEMMNKLERELSKLKELPSNNDTYTFNEIYTVSTPNLVGADETGKFIYDLTIVASIHIYKGVVINGKN